MVSKSVFLGMDDIDSPAGGCTTHFASLLVERLNSVIDDWIDYPNLIRLNPNIPYRTRGNGCVCLKFRMDSLAIDEILSMLSNMIPDYADLTYSNTNPGVVLVTDKIPATLQSFAQKAIWRTLPKSLAFRLIEKHKLTHLIYGNGRGIVGALAAIGHGLGQDHTYEYLAYRRMSDTHKDRGVDKCSVKRMNQVMSECTFSNIDHLADSVLIEPKGPDPVLYGIRGENSRCVIEASTHIKSSQDSERWMVFRTNQGTGEHLSHTIPINRLRPYMSVSIIGEVSSAPEIISGGHVIFRVSDATDQIQCAAYEPTGTFRWEVMKLKVGDKITVHAGVRPSSSSYGMTLNVEGMFVHDLVEHIMLRNPLCNKCGQRMKSAGKDKGFRCPKCGHKEKNIQKIEEKIPRELRSGYYLPQASAQRHLTRPFERVDKWNHFSHELIEKWHNP